MNKKLIIFAFALILLASNVLAIGITPGRSTFDFERNAIKEVEFTVVNSESRDMNLIVLVQGELNESISVSEVSFKMASTEKEKKLRYILAMPPNLKPGLHAAEVVVIQLPEKSEASDAFIGAAVGVATQIHVYVPFPGKYAQAQMNVISNPGKVNFVIPVHNRGDLDLARVRATIDIYSPVNEKIATIQSSEISLLSGERREVAGVWETSSAPGTYRAVATLIYDEETLTIEQQFNVGEEVLKLEQVEVNDFNLGGIAKFEMLVENKWSQQVTAYAQMLVYNKDGEVMADFKSAGYEILPLQKTLMVAFWDTAGVREGTYDASVFLRYGEKSDQQDLKLEVSERNIRVIGVGYVISAESDGEGIFGNTLVLVLIVAVVLLILINITWFLVLRKRLKK
ncbi:hypothetical protein CO038_03860 [Candidatus Pacearchaeota archaeon CG_4_9_14_0_2_um_filter_39_13]|nr:hypothetical protein [Candidatus Pacearchaeota archaeon]OIO44053.1 MAG: hypothetical protein AUJ64_00875 [Candidatus Pacearchaeota archaeon CG1_02_39_14]PJC44412.1 MAG: hypothetical protein CO038_03860 [Candidatus Pacearchaeota archaeon CG_4_9_14_0_2_um_filter_39_13]